MIVVDASALLAILLREDDGDRFADMLTRAEVCLVSPVNWWEVVRKARVRHGELGAAESEMLFVQLGLRLVDVDGGQAKVAIEAARRFAGRPAKLNLADCFAYALAVTNDAPLLFKGDDFIHTDVQIALAT